MQYLFTLDGKPIAGNEQLPTRFICWDGSTAYMWDFTNDTAEYVEISDELLKIILGSKVIAYYTSYGTCCAMCMHKLVMVSTYMSDCTVADLKLGRLSYHYCEHCGEEVRVIG